jgi:putative amidoligase enzyme
MQANQLTFGVEIETVAPDSAVQNEGLRIGRYKHGIQVPYLPAGWTAEADGSIDNSRGGHKCEIVSPVLQGEEGLVQVALVLQTLEAKKHRVNASTGTHVHVGFKRTWDSEALARLVTIVAYLEKGLYAITGTKSRENGIYCGGVRKYGNQKAAKEAIDRRRYHALNLTNLANGTKETVEFRVFSGSLSPIKVVGWVQVCLGLVERALCGKRHPSWNPKPLKGGWKKSGEGQSEAERLMGYLAWGAGYARIHGGKQYGWISDAIPQDAIKAEFRRLAKKYDEQA